LVDTSDIEVLTNADRIEIQRINDEIERLNTEYDTSDEVRTDLLDTISDLEDERDELVSKIDVYNIVPTGEYYQMTEFEVIESADLEGRRYVVGTLDETRESAEEALRQQIDDMGVDAFNHGFAKGHLDKDKIEDTARDYFYQDIWDNPEAFLDDSQRELSNKQDDNINLLERKIKQAEDSIESLEELDGTEEKIEELQDMIVDWEEEIQEIKDDPQGDFPSELIDEKIDEMVEDAVSDPEYFLSNYGLDWADFIDVEALIEEAIDVDGEAHFINSYDGNSDEVTVQDQTFVVMRID
jgi:DNA repair exonuclease SbcCD ATPase subunit